MRNGIVAKLWIFLRTIPYWKLWISNGHKMFLDDIRVPRDIFKMSGDFAYLDKSWIVVRNYAEFVMHLDKCQRRGILPSTISFDHDIGTNRDGSEMSGLDCAKWLVQFCMNHSRRLPKFKVHSNNPCGRENIYGLLNNFKRHQEHNGLES